MKRKEEAEPLHPRQDFMMCQMLPPTPRRLKKCLRLCTKPPHWSWRQLGMVDACNTFSGENPLTPLQAYMAFILQYRINPHGDSWLIPKHAEMTEAQDRQRAAFKWARSWTSISQSEIDEVILDLFALFPADEPAPKSISGLTLRTFEQSLLSAKVSVKEHFVSAASYNVPNVNSCMYFFKVKDFPGPPPRAGVCTGALQ